MGEGALYADDSRDTDSRLEWTQRRVPPTFAAPAAVAPPPPPMPVPAAAASANTAGGLFSVMRGAVATMGSDSESGSDAFATAVAPAAPLRPDAAGAAGAAGGGAAAPGAANTAPPEKEEGFVDAFVLSLTPAFKRHSPRQILYTPARAPN